MAVHVDFYAGIHIAELLEVGYTIRLVLNKRLVEEKLVLKCAEATAAEGVDFLVMGYELERAIVGAILIPAWELLR